MPGEITTPSPSLQADAALNFYRVRTSVIGGIHYPHWLPADPTTGDAFRASGQTDVQEVRDRLPVALVGGKLPVTEPTSLPLPAGAATETTLQGVATQSGQAAAVTALGEHTGLLTALVSILRQVVNTVSMDVATGRTRIVLEAISTGLTLGTITTVTTVTTVATVTNMSQIGTVPANGLVMDVMSQAWASTVRGRIT